MPNMTTNASTVMATFRLAFTYREKPSGGRRKKESKIITTWNGNCNKYTCYETVGIRGNRWAVFDCDWKKVKREDVSIYICTILL